MMPSKINGSHGKDVALRIQNNPSLLATTNEKPPGQSFSEFIQTNIVSNTNSHIFPTF
jgi:hypothetical protein